MAKYKTCFWFIFCLLASTNAGGSLQELFSAATTVHQASSDSLKDACYLAASALSEFRFTVTDSAEERASKIISAIQSMQSKCSSLIKAPVLALVDMCQAQMGADVRLQACVIVIGDLLSIGKFEQVLSLLDSVNDLRYFEDWVAFSSLAAGQAYSELNQPLKAEKRFSEVQEITSPPDIDEQLRRFAGHSDVALTRLYDKYINLWHFGMLNDLPRADMFNCVIKENVNSESVVLDIGSGTGLLAMMAAQNGAKEIVATEMNTLLAENSKQILEDNDEAFEWSSVEVISKHSTKLKIGDKKSHPKEFDMSQKANILIAEVADNWLLGEGVLDTIKHARKNLLTDDAVIIPKGGSIEAMFISSPELRPWRRISEEEVPFDFSDFSSDCQGWGAVRSPLSLDWTPKSKVFKLLDFDFTMYEDKLNSKRSISLKGSASNPVDAIMFWMKLNVDANHILTSKPFKNLKAQKAGNYLTNEELSHWQPFVYIFGDNQIPADLQLVEVSATHSSSLLEIKLEPIKDPLSFLSVTVPETQKKPKVLDISMTETCRPNPLAKSDFALTYWINEQFSSKIFESAYKEIQESFVEKGDVLRHVLLSGTGGAIHALIMLRLGASMVACDAIPENVDLFTLVVNRNKNKLLGGSTLRLLNKDCTQIARQQVYLQTLEELKKETAIWHETQLMTTELPFNRDPMETIRKVWGLIHLIPEERDVPIFLPSSVNYVGIVVQSKCLRDAHSVGIVEGFNLTAFNKFSKPVDEFLDYSLTTDDYTQLTEEFNVIKFVPQDGLDTPTMDLAIENVKIIESGRFDAVITWPIVTLYKDHKIDYRPRERPSTFHQTIEFAPTNVYLKSGNTIKKLRVTVLTGVVP